MHSLSNMTGSNKIGIVFKEKLFIFRHSFRPSWKETLTPLEIQNFVQQDQQVCNLCCVNNGTTLQSTEECYY